MTPQQAEKLAEEKAAEAAEKEYPTHLDHPTYGQYDSAINRRKGFIDGFIKGYLTDREEWLTPQRAQFILNVQTALDHSDVDETHHWLYKLAHPDMDTYEPFEYLKELAKDYHFDKLVLPPPPPPQIEVK